jgi:CRP-like cAMP-binding protein
MDEAQRAKDLLASCAFFKDFKPEQLAIITGFLDVRDGEKGDVLFFEGEQSDAMYVVASGRVELLINDDKDSSRLVGWLGPSESFGELSLLSQSKRQLTVRATNDVTLYELNFQSFVRLRDEHPDVCLQLIMAAISHFGAVMDASHDLLRRLLLRQLSRV